MTRKNYMTKWLFYFLALLPVWFLEAAVLRHMPFFGVFPMLLPLAAVAVAVLEGSVSGAGFGLAVGVLCDAAYYGTGGSMIIVISLIGAAAGCDSIRVQQELLGLSLCSPAR